MCSISRGGLSSGSSASSCISCRALGSDSERLAVAGDYGVEVFQYPHWNFLSALKAGVYCVPDKQHAEIPDLTLFDVYAMVRQDAGASLILTGMKKADSMFRRQTMKFSTEPLVHHPLEDWNKFDVMAYLKANNITPPKAPGKSNVSGLDLKESSLLFLHQHYPDDWQRLLEWFPFAEAAICRAIWYRTGGKA